VEEELVGFFKDKAKAKVGAQFDSSSKDIKKLEAQYNTGKVTNATNKEIELFEIEPIHTTLNGNNLLIQIEPADIRIDTSVSPSYSQVQAYGRADPMLTYGGTSRSYSVSFDMVKSSYFDTPTNVSNNAQVINLLQQLLYASYVETATQNTAVIKTPPFFRIRYGNIIGNFKNGQNTGITGVIKGLRIRMGKIADNITYGHGDILLPREYSVSFSFDVVHEHVVGWYEGKFARDGRNNYPFDTGYDINTGPDGAGNEGTTPSANSPPGSPSYTIAEATQRDDIAFTLTTRKTPRPHVRGGE